MRRIIVMKKKKRAIVHLNIIDDYHVDNEI